ncbi:MAG: mechanosensitive ion channel domain-containing protein [Pseudomonadota bacterium]
MKMFIRNRTNYVIFIVTLILYFFSITQFCHAEEKNINSVQQQTDNYVEENLPISDQDLLDKLEQLNIELNVLNEAYASAEQLERIMLRSQIRAKRKVIARGLKELTKITSELELSGEDTSKSKVISRELIVKITNGLEKSIKLSQQRILELQEKRSSTSAENLPTLDNEIEERSTSIDEDLITFSELSLMLDYQGGDPTSQYQFLDDTVKKRAEILAGILQFLTEEISEMKQVEPVTEEEKQANLVEIATYKQGVDEVARHLRVCVRIMKSRGIDTSSYSQLLIKSTGELTEDIFQSEVVYGLLEGWAETSWNWLLDNGSRWGTKLVVFILILLAFKILATIVKRLVKKAVTNSKLKISQLLRDQIVFFSGKTVIFIGILVALSQLGIQIGPVLAGLGIAGFIMGFALQDTLSNFAAGMMILIYRPFDVGDLVEAGGVIGKVKRMNLVSTTITTFDNQKLVVPNSKIWGDVIRNITAEPNRRVDMNFGISYSDDIDHAERVLINIVKSHKLVLSEPEPDIRLHNLGESSVDFIVRPWAKTADYWTVYWDITREVKKQFDAEGISIPFPQRDVHISAEEKLST